MVRKIELNHICKVEGHASLSLRIREGKVEECQLEAMEGARFFEALVLDKKLKDVQEIVSRICGICSTSHSIASIQALENALNIKPTQNQLVLRKLLLIGERIRSHATHLYFLSLPDYLGFSSALTMTKKYGARIDDALKLIRLGNKIIETFGGREIHPFCDIKKIPIIDRKKILELKRELENSQQTIKKTIELFLGLKNPKFERATDYLSLDGEGLISGKIISKSGIIYTEDYKKHLKENIREYATSKFVLKDGWPYVTGAIARINNNYQNLDKESLSYLKKLGKLPLKNPFYNNQCQAIELLYLTKKAIEFLDNLKEERIKRGYKIKEGQGISAVEAPRGTLFHEYKINKEGKISYCNIIPPTTQNLNMMELDIKNLVNKMLKRNAKKGKIVEEIEKLIRAYDPCFSCSTHFLKVRWL